MTNIYRLDGQGETTNSRLAGECDSWPLLATPTTFISHQKTDCERNWLYPRAGGNQELKPIDCPSQNNMSPPKPISPSYARQAMSSQARGADQPAGGGGGGGLMNAAGRRAVSAAVAVAPTQSPNGKSPCFRSPPPPPPPPSKSPTAAVSNAQSY